MNAATTELWLFFRVHRCREIVCFCARATTLAHETYDADFLAPHFSHFFPVRWKRYAHPQAMRIPGMHPLSLCRVSATRIPNRESCCRRETSDPPPHLLQGLCDTWISGSHLSMLSSTWCKTVAQMWAIVHIAIVTNSPKVLEMWYVKYSCLHYTYLALHIKHLILYFSYLYTWQCTYCTYENRLYKHHR